MVLRIRQPASGRGETVRVVIHRSDFGDVPDIFVPEAVLAQALDIFQTACGGTLGDFHSVVEHRQSASIQAGATVVEENAFGSDGILEQYTHRVAMRGHAVEAIIRSRDDNGDHLTFGLRQACTWRHQVVPMRPPLPEAGLTPGKSAYDIGHEA